MGALLDMDRPWLNKRHLTSVMVSDFVEMLFLIATANPESVPCAMQSVFQSCDIVSLIIQWVRLCYPALAKAGGG